ncbi:hypothetical protein TNCV_3906021 [Trichonephila clavipes]|nr:hypothetical protein TNCV_3906021 [Trichonephila clavipes]
MQTTFQRPRHTGLAPRVVVWREKFFFDCSSTLKVEAFSNRRLKEMGFVEQRMNIKFYVRSGSTAMETYEMLKHVYDSDILSRTQAFESHRRFREDRESVKDDESSGHPQTTCTAENIRKVSAAVRYPAFLCDSESSLYSLHSLQVCRSGVAAVAEWYRYRIVACLVRSSSPVPLKTRRIGQRCTLNLSRAETSSVGVVW